MFSFITFIREGEHELSLGMLMHVKCIYKLCSLLPHIPTYLHVIFMFCIDLWGLSIDPIYWFYNSAKQETPLLSTFSFSNLSEVKRS
jgi:hypothetical protein